MHIGHNEVYQQKKEAVITLLSEHWDEFIAALGARQHTDKPLPVPLQELVMLLSDIIHDESPEYDAHYVYGDESTDEKGLLEKAKYIILKTHTLPEKKTEPIVHKDGLFVIQKHEQTAELDPLFKDLVDSVL